MDATADCNGIEHGSDESERPAHDEDGSDTAPAEGSGDRRP